jgi:hypothetical protein
MSDAPPHTVFPVVVLQGVRDRRLSPVDRNALLVLWQLLSPTEYRPLKAEALGAELGIKRQSAARALSNLVRFGYLLQHQRGVRAVREFLLVNHNPLPLAAPPRALRRVAPLVTRPPAAP